MNGSFFIQTFSKRLLQYLSNAGGLDVNITSLAQEYIEVDKSNRLRIISIIRDLVDEKFIVTSLCRADLFHFDGLEFNFDIFARITLAGENYFRKH